jgi:hypothetical protein
LLALFYRYILTAIQRITQNISTLLAIVWVFSIAGCRDFKDYRTPCKSFVSVVINPINKGDKLNITSITSTAKHEMIQLHRFEDNFVSKFPLDPNADSVQLDIYTSSNTSPEKLTIYYRRRAVLISHQCGCAYEYIIKDVRATPGIKFKILNKKLSTLNDSHIDFQMSL